MSMRFFKILTHIKSPVSFLVFAAIPGFFLNERKKLNVSKNI